LDIINAMSDANTNMSRAARISAKVLKIAGAGFLVTTIAFFVAQIAGVFFVRNWFMLAGLIFSVAGLVAAVVRMSMAIFAESQYRISEVIITLFAAGTVTAITHAIFKPLIPAHARDGVAVVIVLTIFALMGTGSVWGWSAARSLAAPEGWPRMKILIAGWLLVPGLFLLFSCVVTLVITLIQANYGGAFGCVIILVFSTPLYVPGIRIELRRRKAILAKPQPAADAVKAPAASPAVAETYEI
jgi:hypothetical protein